MVKCDYPGCDEKIDYLPFKCKFCGGVYCKKHRLPENHNCPYKPLYNIENNIDNSSQSQNVSINIQDYEEIPIKRKELKREQKLYREVITNTEDNRRRQRNRYTRSFSLGNLIEHSNKSNASYLLITLNIIFLILAYIIPLRYILLDLWEFVFNFRFYTLITAIFVPSGIISLIFTILIIVWTGKMIEHQYGGKFLLVLYTIAGLFGAASTLLLEFIFQYIPYFSRLYLPFSLQNASIIGIIAFLCYSIGLNRELQFFFFFIPIRMKAKYILWFIGIWNIISGIIGPDPSQFGALTAIYAAKLLYNIARQRTIDFRYGIY